MKVNRERGSKRPDSHLSNVAVVKDELKIPLQRTVPAWAEAAKSDIAASMAFMVIQPAVR